MCRQDREKLQRWQCGPSSRVRHPGNVCDGRDRCLTVFRNNDQWVLLSNVGTTHTDCGRHMCAIYCLCTKMHSVCSADVSVVPISPGAVTVFKESRPGSRIVVSRIWVKTSEPHFLGSTQKLDDLWRIFIQPYSFWMKSRNVLYLKSRIKYFSELPHWIFQILKYLVWFI